MKLKIQTLTVADLDAIIALEKQAWPAALQATETTFRERLVRFPRGFLGCYAGTNLAGMTYAHPITEVKKTWEANSNAEAYNLQGKIWYIVNVGVPPRFQHLGVGSALLEENKKLAQKLGYPQLVLGARNIPVNINFYERNGFTPGETISGYLPEDQEAQGKGVIMTWKVR